MLVLLFVSFWGFASLLILTLGLFKHLSSQRSTFLEYILLYGKTLSGSPGTDERIWVTLRVPKRWFSHFYICGSLVNAVILYKVVTHYWLTKDWNSLKYFTTDETTIDPLSVTLLLGLFCIQNLRRLYECIFVSVYDGKGRINFLQYAAGITLYSTFAIAILCQTSADRIREGSWIDYLEWRHCVGITLYAWASIEQHRCHRQLARLRCNDKGDVNDYKHRLPKGGWFEIVTSPHFLMEVLIYTAFVMISGMKHTPMWSIFMFVLCNQTIAALNSYAWYKKTFTSFNDRIFLQKVKAIFPKIL